MIVLTTLFPWAAIGATHFTHQFITRKNWRIALDRSFFQGIFATAATTLVLGLGLVPLT